MSLTDDTTTRAVLLALQRGMDVAVSDPTNQIVKSSSLARSVNEDYKARLGGSVLVATIICPRCHDHRIKYPRATDIAIFSCPSW
jgi:hypothetical protein